MMDYSFKLLLLLEENSKHSSVGILVFLIASHTTTAKTDVSPLTEWIILKVIHTIVIIHLLHMTY